MVNLQQVPSKSSSSQTMDASGKNKRVTMIKSVVGKVKSNQYALPDIVFGIANKMDLEGAGKGEFFFSFSVHDI